MLIVVAIIAYVLGHSDGERRGRASGRVERLTDVLERVF